MNLDVSAIEARIKVLENILYEKGSVDIADNGQHIRISMNQGHPRYYLQSDQDKNKKKNKTPKGGVYIPQENTELAQSIIQKDYDIEVVNSARKELGYLQRFLTHYPKKVVEDIYPGLHPARKLLLSPVILPDDEFVQQWESVTWDPLPFRPDDESEYYNKKGVRMKSKQETILSNYFIDRDVPQRYEFPVQLKGIGEVHPDFMLLNRRTHKEYYWEHLGLWDDFSYRKKAIRKLVAYQRSGIYLGEQLIVTFETANYHPGLYDINQLIDHYLV